MVLRALLLRHESDLKLFHRSARRPGFAQEISALANELQQHHLTPAKLRAFAERADLRRELRDKLLDLAMLSEKYADWLREHELQDVNHLLDFAAAALRDHFRFSGLWLPRLSPTTTPESPPRCPPP